MENTFVKEFRIESSCCDSRGLLSIPRTFEIFMDLASQHAGMLKIGIDELTPKGMFWVVSKTRVRIRRLPKMGDHVQLTTWPQKPDRIRSFRNYRISDGDEILVEGKSEWVVLHLESGKMVSPTEVFPEDLQLREDSVWTDNFSRMPLAFAEKPFAEYTVRSTDIDVGGHMNNAAYVRMINSLWSNGEWNAMDIREMEVFYRSQSYEGQKLLVRQHREEDGSLRLKLSLEDETAVLTAILR